MIDHWQALALRKQGMLHKEIAWEMDCSMGGVQSALWRAGREVAAGKSPPSVPTPVRLGVAKINADQVREIRARRAGLEKYQRGPKGTACWEIAGDFGLTPVYVAKICRGHARKEVE